MTKNPFLNASAGTLYIIFVATFMFYGMNHTKAGNSAIIPIVVLSLFSLSALLMGYFFLYQPILLYLDGKKKQATTLFVRTILVFAGITVGIFILFFSGVIR